MTFLAPLFLVAAGIASLVVIGLHFLVTRPPPLVPFPTARFIPRTTIIVTSLARRPQDILLLILRVAALMLVGAAFARPVLVPRHRDVARILVADHGTALRSVDELRDSLTRIYQPGDRVILLDTAGREFQEFAPESLSTLGSPIGAASLSAGLVAARRVASVLRLEADSIDLVLLSPLARDAWDEATRSLRSAWPGRIALVPLTPRSDSLGAVKVALRARADDPIRAAMALIGPVAASGERIRVVRDSMTASDAEWATRGGALVVWPAAFDAVRDTSNALVSDAGAVVFPFPRARAIDPGSNATVVARWIDGEPAVVEEVLGDGCLRRVGVPMTARGDFVLRPDVLRLTRLLTSVCSRQSRPVVIDSARRAFLAGGPGLAPRELLAAPEAPESPLVPWLLGLAILLVLLEPLLRRSPGSTPEAEA